jgi:hypothetical protein
MTDYTDVPAVNDLYNQRQLVDAAITMLDNGGNMTFFTIEQASPPEGVTPTTTTAPARVTMPPPTPPNTVATIRAWLIQRQSDIDSQLAALGVVNPPMKRGLT